LIAKEINDYVFDRDPDAKENANFDKSYSGLESNIIRKMIRNYVLDHWYPYKIRQAHRDGDLHIHNLAKGLIPYCFGANLHLLLLKGLETTRITTKPPRHLSSAVDHIVNYLCTSQQEFAGAQAISDVNYLLAPYIRKDNLSYKELKQNIQRLIFNLNFPSRSGYQCVTEDTLILTKDGWKGIDEVTEGQLAWTINPETKELELLPIEKVVRYFYSGPVYHLYNKRSDQLVVPEHRVLHYPYYSKKLVFTEAKDLAKRKAKILVPAKGELSIPDYPISDLELRLWAWVLSEGSIEERKNGMDKIVIGQSTKHLENINRIRGILRDLGYKWKEYEYPSEFSNIPVKRIVFYARGFSKEFPEFLHYLSRRQARLFLDEYRLGDGSKDRFRLYTKNLENLRILQELCVKAGYLCSTRQRSNGVFDLSVVRDFTDRTYVKIEKEEYSGRVWGIHTKNNTMITLRNGKIAITGNTPFTNFIMDFACPPTLKDIPVRIGDEDLGAYEDYTAEALMFLRAFNQVMYEGDAKHRVFTFPIPTLNIKPSDLEYLDTDLFYEIMKTDLKYGIYYYFNFVGSGIKVGTKRAMCCRLILDLDEIPPPSGRWTFESGTGSLGVVSLNMARLGYLSREEDDLFDRLSDLLEIAKEALLIKGEIVDRSYKAGLLPLCQKYGVRFDRFFRTIGVIGLNEMCLNFLGEPLSSSVDFVEKVLKFIREKTREFSKESGFYFNLEMTPGEGSAYRLALLDRQKYPDIITLGTREKPYYTTLLTPPSEDLGIGERMRIEEPLLVLFTGGTVHRIFLGEAYPSVEAMAKLVSRIMRYTRIPYLDISNIYSICNNCGLYLSGEHYSCPDCGSSMDVYSRIVGFYRPLRRTNPGKEQEIKDRIYRKELRL